MKIMSLIFLALVFCGGVYYYISQGQGGAGGNAADLQKMLHESGAAVTNLSCKQIGSMRRVSCHFQSSAEDVRAINNFLKFSPQDDASGLRGEFFFIQNDKNPCDYKTRTARGDTWQRASWVPSKIGDNAQYSGASIIYDKDGVDVCMILDIAYG